MGLFTPKERVIERVVEKEKIVEKEVIKYLLGDVEKVTFYVAYREDLKVIGAHMGLSLINVEDEIGLYYSCAQAFEENPGCKVKTNTYWKVGEHLVKSLDVVPVSLRIHPKPKCPKGKVSK